MSDQPFLIAAYDRLGPVLAGPAIRCLALARELTRLGQVDVVFDGPAPEESIEHVRFIERSTIGPLPGFFAAYRAALAPPLVALTLPELLDSDLPLVVDLFDPVVWENLDLYRSSPASERDFQHERHLAAILAALVRGDFFLAAGRRQVDLFLGALMALNRVNPSTWVPGAGPEQLVGLVPFGIPDHAPPSADQLPLPDEYKTSGPMVVWGGGMWDWLRPEIVVQAWPEVLKDFPQARLAFPGTEHPNPHVPRPGSVDRVRKLSKELGVAETLIFGKWLPRDEYLGLLAHAGCCVSAHGPGLETRYAVRTRFLDAIWMGLPLVVSDGDEYSGYIAESGLGAVVPASDPSGFGKAIIQVLRSGRGAYGESFIRARGDLTWGRMADALVKWATSPRITHGEGAGFFSDSVGRPSPRNRPGDLDAVMRRLVSKLKRT